MTACCKHSSEWHAYDGCRFPECPCKATGRSAAFPRPKGEQGEQITRCSRCQRRPNLYGGNHARLCPRAGIAPDTREDRKP